MKKLFYQCFTFALMLSSCTVVAAPKDAIPVQVQKQVIAKGKQLKSPQMRLLNMVFEERPNAVVRTKITCAKCAKAIQAVNELQQAYEKTKKPGEPVGVAPKYFETDAQARAFIVGHLRLLVDPVKPFFESVRDHKSLVTPVIAESLCITTRDIAKSWLLKFFETNDDVVTFFDREIKAVEDLKSASLELISVFNDVNESLSERARKNCDEVIKKMQEAQKQAAEQKKA